MVKQNGKPAKKKRAAMGRPSLTGAASPGARSPIVGVRLPDKDLSALDSIAAREGVKRSEMVRRLLLAGIAAYKPGKVR